MAGSPAGAEAGDGGVVRRGPVRFAAVDDHAVLLGGIEWVAQRYPQRVRFTGTAQTVTEHLSGHLSERTVDPADGPGQTPSVDVVLLDLRLADMSRPRDNVRRLLAAGRRVLVFTEGDREAMIADAVEAGAQGVVLKSQAEPEDLVLAIEQVADGQLVLSPEVAAVIDRDVELRPRLTPRERETLRLLTQGLVDRQIAQLMSIGESTVKENLKRIRVKYVAHGRPAPTRVELHHRAVEDGYDEPTGDEG